MKIAIDYSTPAELFPSRRYARSLARYRRFPSAADAVRYVMEEQPASWLVGSTLHIGDRTFEGKAISALYQAEEYPLPRSKVAA